MYQPSELTITIPRKFNFFSHGISLSGKKETSFLPTKIIDIARHVTEGFFKKREQIRLWLQWGKF